MGSSFCGTPSDSSRSATARQPWLAVGAIGMATFSVVTTEMLPVGLLTPVADSLGTTVGMAGLMVSMPALLAALFAPLVVIASGGIDRRKILIVLLGLLAAANLACAWADSLTGMLAARALVGLCMGGIWAIAGGLAVRLVPARSVGLATSIIFGGVAAASVLGVPLGASIGDFAGWRAAFGCLAVLSGAVLLLHVACVPALPVREAAGLRDFAAQLGNRRLCAGLLLTFAMVAGHFMAFTFVRPMLVSVSGFDAAWVGALLFAYGSAGILGNFLAGVAATRRAKATLVVIAAGLLSTPAAFLWAGDSKTGGAIVLLLWGLAYGGVSVSLMTYVMQTASRAMEMATAWLVALFNVGIAVGSFAGGRVVDAHGLDVNLCAALGLLALALGIAALLRPAAAPAA